MLLSLILLTPLTTQAQYVHVRVSVKFILNGAGQPPIGVWSDRSHWRRAIEVANAGNARMGRGFRYLEPDFDGNVSGFSTYYDLEKGEEVSFEYEVRSNLAQSRWRADALNVYVVHNNLGTAADPACAGWASNPQDTLGPNAPHNTMRGKIVVFCVDMEPAANPFSILAHEFGHHMGLIHTWADDRVEDTPYDANPEGCEVATVPDWCSCKFSNTLVTAALQGWTPQLLTVMTNNVMSYHCDNDLDFDLTEGQLDRWADMTRMFLADECTGVTHFVQTGSAAFLPDGYSRSYFSVPPGIPSGGPFPTVQAALNAAGAGGGDILILRRGAYHEQLRINKPVTLRATRLGAAIIGQ